MTEDIMNSDNKTAIDYTAAEELSDYLQLDSRRYDTVIKGDD